MKGRRVLLLRHGNTEKADVDAVRALSEKGRRECVRYREAYRSQLVGVSAVFASYVPRAMQTATLLVEPLGLKVMPVEDLYFGRPWRTDEMCAADKVLGYAPAREYLERFPGVYEAAGRALAGAVVSGAAAGLPAGDLMIVGHAGYLSLLALEVVDALAPSAADPEAWKKAARQVVLEANVGEVCGFELCPSLQVARYCPNPECTDFQVARHNDAFVTSAKGD